MQDAVFHSLRPTSAGKPLLAIVLLSVLIATAVTLPFLSTFGVVTSFFEVEATSERPCRVQVFFDIGNGFREQDSSWSALPAGLKPVRLRFALPSGSLRALRLDPAEGPGNFTFRAARIVASSGRTLHIFQAADFAASEEIASVNAATGAAHVTTTPGAQDPQLLLRLTKPVPLRSTYLDLVRLAGPRWFVTALLVGAACWLVGRVPGNVGAAAASACSRRPVLTLAVGAALAVGIQCHPVLFCGRSFVSPDNAGFLLYDHFPTLPGYESTGLEDGKGSDVGAILYANLHYPGLQRDAVFRDHELPLWNRYVQGGEPMLGQGQSMFGGVLNLIPMFGGSSALSWDVRFLLSRWLYAWGVGLAVWLLTRHLGAAAITGFSCVFVGFFAFRLNHMAQFSVDVSPWLLVAWLRLRDQATPCGAAWSLALLLLANWEMVCSGTVKEAHMLMLFLNLTGLTLAVIDSPPAARVRLVVAAAATGVILILVSAPHWLVFLDTLGKSATHYDFRNTHQASLPQLIGFFEDLIVRQLRPGETHAFPSANLLVLLGCSWALLGGWRSRSHRGAYMIALMALLPLALAFGVVPSRFFEHVPLVSKIEHFDNTFGVVGLVLLTVLSGFGVQAFLTDRGSGRWRRDALAVLGGVLLLAVLFAVANPGWSGSAFFKLYAASLLCGLVALLVTLRASDRLRHRGLLVVGLTASLVVLLWRHSQYVRTPFDAYVFNPKVRADLTPSSPAIERVRQLSREPNRSTGLSYNLFSGYAMALRLETIYGIEPLRSAYFDDLTIYGGINKMNWGDPSTWHETDARVLLRLEELLNVRYYLTSRNPQSSAVSGLEPRGSYDLDVFESPGAWPRAFFTAILGTYRTVHDLLQRINDPNQARPFAFVEETDASPLRALLDGKTTATQPVRARDYALTSNTTSFTIEAPGPGVAVLTEAYNPDFRVTLNGADAAMLRVNHAFKGVVIPHAGSFRVCFAYCPAVVSRALWLAAFGASAAVAGFWLVLSGRFRITPNDSA